MLCQMYFFLTFICTFSQLFLQNVFKGLILTWYYFTSWTLEFWPKYAQKKLVLSEHLCNVILIRMNITHCCYGQKEKRNQFYHVRKCNLYLLTNQSYFLFQISLSLQCQVRFGRDQLPWLQSKLSLVKWDSGFVPYIQYQLLYHLT